MGQIKFAYQLKENGLADPLNEFGEKDEKKNCQCEGH